MKSPQIYFLLVSLLTIANPLQADDSKKQQDVVERSAPGPVFMSLAPYRKSSIFSKHGGTFFPLMSRPQRSRNSSFVPSNAPNQGKNVWPFSQQKDFSMPESVLSPEQAEQILSIYGDQ